MPINTISNQPQPNEFENYLQQYTKQQSDQQKQQQANVHKIAQQTIKNQQQQTSQLAKSQQKLQEVYSKDALKKQAEDQKTEMTGKLSNIKGKISAAEGTVSFPQSPSDETIKASFDPATFDKHLADNQKKIQDVKDSLVLDKYISYGANGRPDISHGKFNNNLFNTQKAYETDQPLIKMLTDIGYSPEEANYLISQSNPLNLNNSDSTVANISKNSTMGGLVDTNYMGYNPSDKYQAQYQDEVSKDEATRADVLKQLGELSYNQLDLGLKPSNEELLNQSNLETYANQLYKNLQQNNTLQGQKSGNAFYDLLNQSKIDPLADLDSNQPQAFGNTRDTYNTTIKDIQNQNLANYTENKKDFDAQLNQALQQTKEQKLYASQEEYNKNMAQLKQMYDNPNVNALIKGYRELQTKAKNTKPSKAPHVTGTW